MLVDVFPLPPHQIVYLLPSKRYGTPACGGLTDRQLAAPLV